VVDSTLEEEEARPFYKRALDLGINFFDTADMYSLGRSEEITGKVLGELVPRDEVVIATKVYNPLKEGPNARGLSRKHIFEALEASLRRLRVDYVDLYQIHRWDNETPIEETLRALEELVRAGKVRYIGASSMYAWQFCKALYTSRLHGWSEFVSMQNQYNAIYREEEREMLPLCADQGVAVIPWSPMARGFLGRTKEAEAGTTRAKTDQQSRTWYYKEQDFRIRDQVAHIAQARSVAPAQIALAWLLHQPWVTAPIIGSTKLEHLDAAVAATEIALTEEEVEQIREPYRTKPVIGRLSEPEGFPRF
jgi:aryl-alcohol dehydrogenase (NADP+)